jgi:hypothetical protein
MSTARLVWVLITSLLGGGLIVTALTLLTLWLPPPDDSYGAPFSVGSSCFAIPVMRCQTTFSAALFVLDVAIYVGALAVLGRWSGLLGLIAAILAACASLVVFVAMVAAEAPLRGAPVPLWHGSPVHPVLTLWLDTLIWAAVASWVVVLVRHRGRMHVTAP